MSDQSTLYTQLTRLGKYYSLNIFHSPEDFLQDIKIFQNDWKKYNPRKSIPREGLSITSLDGGLSGIPDLDSLAEYNRLAQNKISEKDIVVPTPVYKYALPYFSFIKNFICRSHVIKLPPGGYFPPHRDNCTPEIDSFRLFVPLANCNPPNMYFLMEETLIQFQHGRVYFIDTSLVHTLFNASVTEDCYFIVFNVILTNESVKSVFSHVEIT